MQLPSSAIRAVLFDADGVVQSSAVDWKTAFARFIGSAETLDEFTAEVFAAEIPALVGVADFKSALATVLKRWGSQVPVEEALTLWTSIDVADDVLDLVRDVRECGVGVYLATNQQAHRALFMSRVLGYGDVFDKEFYSCQLGVKKPAAEFFEAILADLGLRPASVLFVDDSEANVEAARSIGLNASSFQRSDGAQTLRAILGEFDIDLTTVKGS